MIGEKTVKQYQVDDRRIISTIEDQSKYDMPNGRILRVQANPVNMPLSVRATNNANQLLQALGEIRPQLLDYAAERQGDIWAAEAELGKQDANVGADPEAERSRWRQHAYEYQTSFLKGEDLAAKIEADIVKKDPEEDFGQWYQQWWEQNATGVAPTNPEYLGVFNKAFTKGMLKAREADAKALIELERTKQYTASSESIYRSIFEIRGGPKPGKLPLTVEAWNAIKNSEQKLYGFSNQEMDELFFTAVKRYAEEYPDPDAINVFYEHRGEVPALINNPKWTDKIMKLRETVVAEKNKRTAATEKAEEDSLKAEAQQAELELTLALAQAEDLDDPAQTAERIDGIMKAAEALVAERRLPIKESVINNIRTANRREDKNLETVEQQATFQEMRVGIATLSLAEIHRAAKDGVISNSGFKELVSAKESYIRAAKAAAGKGEKPYNKTDLYKSAIKEIDANIAHTGFDTKVGATRSQKEANWMNITVGWFNSEVELLLAKDVPLADAVKEAKKTALERAQTAGYRNTVLDKEKARVNNPKQIYLQDPKKYVDEVEKNGKPAFDLPKEDRIEILKAYDKLLDKEKKDKSSKGK